jgi:hypothetical protein
VRIRVHKGNLEANRLDGGDRPVVLLNLEDGTQRNEQPFVLWRDMIIDGRVQRFEVLRIGYDKREASLWVETQGEIEVLA